MTTSPFLDNFRLADYTASDTGSLRVLRQHRSEHACDNVSDPGSLSSIRVPVHPFRRIPRFGVETVQDALSGRKGVPASAKKEMATK